MLATLLLPLLSLLTFTHCVCVPGLPLGDGLETLPGEVKLFVRPANTKGIRLPVDISYDLEPFGFYQALKAIPAHHTPTGIFQYQNRILYGSGGTYLSVRGLKTSPLKYAQIFMAADSGADELQMAVFKACTDKGEAVYTLDFEADGLPLLPYGPVTENGTTLKPGSVLFRPARPLPARLQSGALLLEVVNSHLNNTG